MPSLSSLFEAIVCLSRQRGKIASMANSVRNRRPNLSELSIKKDINGDLNGGGSAHRLTLLPECQPDQYRGLLASPLPIPVSHFSPTYACMVRPLSLLLCVGGEDDHPHWICGWRGSHDLAVHFFSPSLSPLPLCFFHHPLCVTETEESLVPRLAELGVGRP